MHPFFRFHFLILGFILLHQVIAAPETGEHPDWPKGINPATLLTNNDAEPDLQTPGFINLFNGKDLSGWTIHGGNMRFEVSEGAIVGHNVPHEGNSFLCTEEDYEDFIFTCEFKWSEIGNSGIMFRADTKEPDGKGIRRVFGYQAEMDPSERSWSGGIYGEVMGGWKYPLSKEQGHAAARAAIQDYFTWNRITIYARGNVIKTWINGVPCSYLINDDRSSGFFGLQVHSGKQGVIHWRDIRVKELEPAQRAINLFASDDFSQWSRINGNPVTNGWTIEAGIIHRNKEGAGDIITRKSYKNFELIFEWKIAENGNSGVKYRTKGSIGLEYQILDDEQNADNEDQKHLAASLYDLVAAPADKPIHPVGEWNTARIMAQDNSIKHWLNGKEVISIEYGSEEWEKHFGQSKYRKKEGFGDWIGPILLQDHDHPVWFRNMYIREL